MKISIMTPVPSSNLSCVVLRGLGRSLGSVFALGLAAAAALGTVHHVSQRGRAFTPGKIAIQAGDIVEFMNDDGDLLHHAFLESDRFRFDTGDQEPGSKTIVTFTTPGTFVVLCGIHPKMKLVVEVK